MPFGAHGQRTPSSNCSHAVIAIAETAGRHKVTGISPLVDRMDSIEAALIKSGFAFRPGSAVRAWVGPAWEGWASLASSWDDLGADRHMADGGRYRRRRYAVFDATSDAIVRAPHQPHFQARTYNRLNGGLERWFDPVKPEIGDHPIIQALIGRIARVFDDIVPAKALGAGWHVELHQFRIEASADAMGHPTPEGVHRDGVDGAFVMLIDRRNVSSGVTHISDAKGKSLGQFTLGAPGDAVFLDDARVFHGVTPIAPLDPRALAIRDVLVITFTRSRSVPMDRGGSADLRLRSF